MIDLDHQDRLEFYEFKGIVEDIEAQADLYEETDDWKLDREEGPVSTDIARYVLEQRDHFFKLWNQVHESVKNECERQELESKYRDLQDTIFEHQDFLEDVYQLQKPLGRAKVEARYPW